MGVATGRQQSRLLDGLPPSELERAVEILASCASVEVDAGAPYFPASFSNVALLVVEEGFVIVRTAPRVSRSIITCEAGAGAVLLPPAAEETLYGLVASRLTAIPFDERDRLLELPGVAQALLEQLTATLSQKQEAIGNFADTRHVERVRRKLLQLARNHGRVGPDGIRIDFPVSHTLLAEMIGSSRETVTRAVDELQRDGFVARRGHSYRLLVSPDACAEV
jgi:Crp-like helix-turn-helix domain